MRVRPAGVRYQSQPMISGDQLANRSDSSCGAVGLVVLDAIRGGPADSRVPEGVARAPETIDRSIN